MSEKPVPIAGEVGDISETDAARLSVVALRGNTVLATAQLRPDGSYLLNLPRAAAREESAFALQVAVLPSTAAAHPDRVADAPRVSVEPGALEGEHLLARRRLRRRRLPDHQPQVLKLREGRPRRRAAR